jgi:hypothetical protein
MGSRIRSVGDMGSRIRSVGDFGFRLTVDGILAFEERLLAYRLLSKC